MKTLGGMQQSVDNMLPIYISSYTGHLFDSWMEMHLHNQAQSTPSHLAVGETVDGALSVSSAACQGWG